jgi:hypothetical protein
VFIQLAQSKCSVFMAFWLVRERRVPVVIVELLEGATRCLVRREIRQAHWTEQAAPCLAVEKRPARATVLRALFALAA